MKTFFNCRWDAKPDNQFGHSFPQGFNAPAHPTFWALFGLFFGLLLNWRGIREYFGHSVLPLVLEVGFSIQHVL